MTSNRILELPHADGVLPEHPIQWWYWNGHLRAEDGRRLGFHLAFFAGEAVPGLVWGQMAHASIVDLSARRCEKVCRLWAGAPLRVEGRFALESPCRAMAALGGGGRERLRLDAGGRRLELRLGAERPPAIHYGGRPHRYSFGGHSYHYSRTAQRVRGTLLEDGRGPVAVEGRAWFDRQIGALSPLVLGGWQWFAVQLEGAGELMIFDFNGAREERFAAHVDPRGGARTFGASSVDVEPLGQWKSERTGVTYPHGWRVRTPSHELEVRPRFEAQEMAGWLAPAYWEGSCEVSGTHGGDAYVELVGGLPRTFLSRRAAEPASLLSHPALSLGLAAAAGAAGGRLSVLTPRFPFDAPALV